LPTLAAAPSPAARCRGARTRCRRSRVACRNTTGHPPAAA